MTAMMDRFHRTARLTHVTALHRGAIQAARDELKAGAPPEAAVQTLAAVARYAAQWDYDQDSDDVRAAVRASGCSGSMTRTTTGPSR